MSTPRKNKTAKEIFNAAIEYYDPYQWEEYIADTCGDDEALRRRVRDLLDAHRQSDSFLDGNPERTDDFFISERPGMQIGPYKLLQQIGEGGFGVVYMAEQIEPVRRKVALKIIKPGMDTKQVIARFEAERQALAMMDHPNIAKVLDAGATESGRPYFVMELVKGVPVTEFCDANKLPTRERLDLFITVCRAVQHAHQKGIIHRDLKPTNVMVTLHDNKPMPVIIDFGVSKAISQQLTEKTLFTAYGQMVGTPQYMSPEQAQMSRLDIDTRSDVYSLGVLLYELLTGSTPLESERLRTLAYAEVQRVIREEDPPRPSARLSTLGGRLTVVATHRGTDAKRLAQLLRGDLDWIVMKALSKERGRRYESASSFAADVERHLADEMIEARPPSTSYQIARFVRRHKGPAITAAVVFLALLLGIAGTTTGLIMANNARMLAEDEARRAGSARAAEAAARKVAVEAQGETLAALSQLSASHAKVSEQAARAATQRALGLVAEGHPQEGLLWLNRALELLPTKGTPLEREIRSAMSAVVEKLPRPLFVVSPDEGQTFSRTDVSLNGERALLLVETDPPAERMAIEVRVIDTRSGAELSRIDVAPETHWAGLSGDGRTVFTADPKELRRYLADGGASDGPAYDLANALEEHASPFQTPEEVLQRMIEANEELARRLTEQPTRRIPATIVSVDPTGRTAIFRSRPPGRPGTAEGGGPFGTRFGLLDLESGRTEMLPVSPRPFAQFKFVPDGRRLWATDRNARSLQLSAWDLAAGEFQETWDLPIYSSFSQWSISGAGDRVLLRMRDMSAGGAWLCRVLDLRSGESLAADLEVSREIIGTALSPTGGRAAILTSPDPQSTEIIVWDLAKDLSRNIPLRLTLSDRFTRSATRPGPNGPGRGIGSQDRLDAHVAFSASEDTVLTWSHDLLVGWRLVSEPRRQPVLATPRSMQSLQYLRGGHELAAIVAGNSGAPQMSRSRQPVGLDPIEFLRFDIQERRLIGPALPVVADLAALSFDGKTLATVCGDEIRCWNTATMRKIDADFRVPEAQGRTFTHLEFVDGGRVLVGHRLNRTFASQSPGRTRINYSFIGTYTKPAERGLLVYDLVPDSPAAFEGLTPGDVILRISEHPVKTISELRKYVDLASADGVEVTFLRDGKEQRRQIHPTFRTEEDVCRIVSQIAGEVRLWDVQNGRELGELPIPLEGEIADPERVSAAAAPDGRWVVTVSQFGQRAELRKFNAQSGRPAVPSVEYPRPILTIQCGPHGRVLATLDSGSEVQLWNAGDLTRIGPRIRPAGFVDTMAFDPKGDALLVASHDDEGPWLTVWDTRTGYRLSPPIELPARASRLACHPDGASVAIAGRSNRSEDSVWEFPLPELWGADASDSLGQVEALTGCTLTEQGNVEPLAAARWHAQIARIEPVPTRPEPEEDRDLMTASADNDRLSTSETGMRSLDERIAALGALIEERPDDPRARMQRAELLLAQGRFDEASEDLEAAAAHSSRETIISWLKRQPAAPRRGQGDTRWERCLWCSERLLAMEPEDPTSLLLRTLALVQTDRFDEAEEAMGAAVQAGPEGLVFENLLAFVQVGSASLRERSAWLLGRLIEMRPDDWRLPVRRAEIAVREERFDDALADIDRAAALGPAEMVAEQVGRLAGTTSVASRRGPGSGNALTVRQLREAARLYERSLELDPDHLERRRSLASVYGRCADWENAAEQFERVVKSDREDKTSCSWLAALKLRQRDNERYDELCQELEARYANTGARLWAAAPAHDYRPFMERAQKRLDDPDRSDRERPYPEWDVGCAYFRSGRFPPAIERLKSCAESAEKFSLHETRIRALSVLAMAYHKSGDDEKARESLDRAAELFANEAPQFGVDDLGANWPNWLVTELLLEEAKGKIGGDGGRDDAAPTQESVAPTQEASTSLDSSGPQGTSR